MSAVPEQNIGPYKILRLLGRGGMGTVYAGVHVDTQQLAAGKVLSALLADSPHFRERFSAEVDTLKKLRHPNIVELYGYGEHENQLFYAMELVEGRSLEEELHAKRDFSWAEVLQIGIQISKALKHAHDHGVIHRDLKPANLLATEDRLIKLTDFGIAKLFGVSNMTRAGSVIGTADYMSPEQAEGAAVTHRADLYSLGAVMYALLAKRPPFTGSSLPQVIHSLRYEEVPSVHRYNPKVPDELEHLIAELLIKDPNKRIANAYVLANRLQAMHHALTNPTLLGTSLPSAVDEPPLVRGVASPTSLRATAEYDTAELKAIEAERQEDATFVTGPSPEKIPVSNPADVDSNRFTEVTEQERGSAIALETESDPTSWLRIGLVLLIVVLVAAGAWLLSRPESADDLFTRIESAAAVEDPLQLAAHAEQMEEFQQRFPDDPRREQVAEYQMKLRLYRYPLMLEREAKRLGGMDALLPVERVYVQALELETVDPQRAATKLQALLDVYGGSALHGSAKDAEDTALCLRLAEEKLKRLRASLTEAPADELAVVAERLQWARQHRTTDTRRARLVAEGIVELYRDKPWAQRLVSEARELLQQ